ncbi:hypothetical protein LguiA_035237 [Lonicera macranthoides]
MNKSIFGTHNLLEKSLEGIRFYTWSELLAALKQCEDLVSNASSLCVVHQCVDILIGRISLASETSPCPSTSSPDSSGFRLSIDSRSTESFKNSSFRSTWWFEDLVALDPCLVQVVIKSMVIHRFDHGIISRFLFYYHKSRFITATSDQKRDVTETVVDMLYSLDHSSVSCKRLFGILRIALNLGVRKCCKRKLESMIGSQLDRANLDDLLVPSSFRAHYLYNVNLVLRFINSCLGRGMGFETLVRSKKVVGLIDLYIAEVAPDPYLKPSKFLALVKALPDSARDSFDAIYHAMDIYLEVHANLSEEEKMLICCGLNYEKLSLETCKHLTRNAKFPTKSAIQAVTSQQSKLKSLLKDTNQSGLLNESRCSSVESESKAEKDEVGEQIVLYAGNLDVSCDNHKLKAHLQGMQRRVLELEEVCKKMQTQMTKMKSRHSYSRSLPLLCS